MSKRIPGARRCRRCVLVRGERGGVFRLGERGDAEGMAAWFAWRRESRPGERAAPLPCRADTRILWGLMSKPRSETSGPKLISERLTLEPLCPGDAHTLRALLSLEPVRRYLLDGKAPEPELVRSFIDDSIRDFKKTGLGLWAARREGGRALLGLAGFRDVYTPPQRELLFAVHPGVFGMGYAPEMARAVLRHAFESAGQDRVRASTDLPNLASMAVLRKLGMRETGREAAPPGCIWEQVHFALEREEWERGEETHG